MASARGKSRQRRGDFIKQQRRLGRRANVPTPRSFRGDFPAGSDEAIQKYAQWYGGSKSDKTGARRRLDSPLEKEIKKFGSNVGDLTRDVAINPAKKGIDYLASAFKNFKLPTMMGMEAAARSLEEDKAASRDYGIPWWKGGNPTAVDRGSAADRYLTGAAPGLTSLIQDRGAYNEALDKDRLFTQNLNEMTGDNYEAKAGYLALLNDPSRLKDMDPIRGLNYMRSITGEPSNMGFDEFEAMRKSQPEVYGGLTATEIAKKLLPQYTQQADEMYGQGFIGNTAAATYGNTTEVPSVIKQATGVAPVDIERLRLQGKGGHQDLTTIAPQADEIWDTIPTSVFSEDDKELGINWGKNESLYPQMQFKFPYGQLGDPDVSAEGEEFLTPTSFNAASIYPNLNLAHMRNKTFPGMNLQDITQEDLNNLTKQQRYFLGG